ARRRREGATGAPARRRGAARTRERTRPLERAAARRAGLERAVPPRRSLLRSTFRALIPTRLPRRAARFRKARLLRDAAKLARSRNREKTCESLPRPKSRGPRRWRDGRPDRRPVCEREGARAALRFAGTERAEERHGARGDRAPEEAEPGAARERRRRDPHRSRELRGRSRAAPRM